ncbi:M10 family metallopeptidase C-terminal domain-containing protein [Microvirga sp. VF16]|uniref:M10 family metallopeptidase C-terminal domain-containing protein n=1 Tax=Microvirga sp. VF16 TaxID=2807101 RepID=UPI00193E4A3F|nr:hypothetical protein [Microvirga sp. VF16]QRM29522.1 hypothetical protein JO965_00325 [Microvirga sp. VF16]
MGTTIFSTNLDGDWHRISPNVGVYLDWGSNSTVDTGWGILDIQVAVMLADPVHDRLELDTTRGVSATNGLNVGSIITIGGYSGIIAPGGSGTYNFHLFFDYENESEYPRGLIAATFIQSLVYRNTSETLADDFYRQIYVGISNTGGGENGEGVDASIVTVTKWLPHHGEGNVGGSKGGGTGGLNLPPEITGDLRRKTISDMDNPFSLVGIADANGDPLTVSVVISDPKQGSFLASSLGGGTYNSLTGTYTISGTPAQVQAAIRNLIFTQAPHLESASPSVAPISFQIIVSDVSRSTVATIDADLWINRADVIRSSSRGEKLYGHSGKDKLYGNGGNDKLWGGSGSDSLSGGTGKDTFVFDTKPDTKSNRDKIADFKVTDDSIWLDNAVFTKLGKSGTEAKPAALKSSSFTIGSKAKDRNDYIVYDSKKGVLYYDADGSGKGKAVEIASLSKKLAMTYKDFFVI